LFHADGRRAGRRTNTRAESHDEANGHFSQLCNRPEKRISWCGHTQRIVDERLSATMVVPAPPERRKRGGPK